MSTLLLEVFQISWNGWACCFSPSRRVQLIKILLNEDNGSDGFKAFNGSNKIQHFIAFNGLLHGVRLGVNCWIIKVKEGFSRIACGSWMNQNDEKNCNADQVNFNVEFKDHVEVRLQCRASLSHFRRGPYKRLQGIFIEHFQRGLDECRAAALKSRKLRVLRASKYLFWTLFLVTR